MNIFRGGIFKQIRYLFSTPQESQNVIYISEAGTVSQEILPVDTGFVSSEKKEKDWAVVHALKFQIYENGEPTGETALVVSDRSYLPLDPFGVLKQKDKERMASLGEIAKVRHAQERSKASKAIDPRTKLAELVLNWGFIVLCIFAVLAYAKGC